jgi:hypothetical protein
MPNSQVLKTRDGAFAPLRNPLAPTGAQPPAPALRVNWQKRPMTANTFGARSYVETPMPPSAQQPSQHSPGNASACAARYTLPDPPPAHRVDVSE